MHDHFTKPLLLFYTLLMSGEKPRFCFTVSLKLRPLFLGVITGELAKALLHIVLYSFSETTVSVFLGVITGELVKALL